MAYTWPKFGKQRFDFFQKNSVILLAVILLLALLSFWVYALSQQTRPFIVTGIHTASAPKISILPKDLQNEAPLSASQMNTIGAVSGSAFIDLHVLLIQKELDSFGGWLPNDVFPLTRLLDNKVNFQLGAREALMRSLLILRENLSRQDRTTSALNVHVRNAYGRMSVNPDSWMFPRYEGELNKSIDALRAYQADLQRGKAGFFPRADTLIRLNEQFSSLLGAETAALMADDVTMFDSDDRFYHAKGVAYILYELYQVIGFEFADTLEKNDGNALLASIVAQLDAAYFEPDVVFNGDSESWRNNHLKQLATRLYSVRQKINSVNSVLLHTSSSSAG
ncbi:MAG: DUF2333 family protein [Mariprofundaceae bacterium]|nr:DUF2333 family protein [Mariprofundaceae bacterium]